MAKFPETVELISPVQIKMRTAVLSDEMDDIGAAEKVKIKMLYPKRDVILSLRGVNRNDMEDIWMFLAERAGGWFNLFLKNYHEYKELIGVYESGTSNYNMPCKSGSLRTLYKNGSTVSSGFTYTQGAGTDGADRLAISSGFSSGDIITAHFDGYLKVRCRAINLPSFDTFMRELHNISLHLRGTHNA